MMAMAYKQLMTYVQLIIKSHLDHLVDITFRTSKLCRIFNLDQHYEVEVVPQVVFHTEVLLE